MLPQHVNVRFAGRIVVIHKGTIAADGNPADTITNKMIVGVFEDDPNIGAGDRQPYVLRQRMQ